MTHDGRRRAILAIDTATTHVVIATGTPEGVADGLSAWTAGYRHGETLLPAIGRFLGEQNIRRSRLVGIVVGTGPGAFTGLRVGIATAKGLAHGLGIPLVGASTAEALIVAYEAAEAAVAVAEGLDGPAAPSVLLLPAGPRDRLVVRAGSAPIPLPAGEEPELGAGNGSWPWISRGAPRTMRSLAARRHGRASVRRSCGRGRPSLRPSPPRRVPLPPTAHDPSSRRSFPTT